VPRSCTVCSHDECHAINVALVQRDTYRHIASSFGVSTKALQRHSKDHLPELLLKAKDAADVAEADSLLMRIEGLYKRTEAILEAAEEGKEWGTALAAIRECRGNLELLGRVTKELESAPTFNLTLNPQWLELRALIVRAVEPFPDARESILRAIRSVDNGSPPG
jgi:hypothetical protein